MHNIDFKNLNLEQTFALNDCFEEAKGLFENSVEIFSQANSCKEFYFSSNGTRDQFNNRCFEAILQFCLLKKLFSPLDALKISHHNPFLGELTKQYSDKWQTEKVSFLSVAFKILKQFLSLAFFEFGLKILSWKCHKKKISTPVILMDIFVLPTMIVNGQFKDRYYPNYKNYFKSTKGLDFYYYPTILIGGRDLISKFKSMVALIDKENFILPQHYISIKNYLSAFFVFFRSKFQFPEINVDGIDYSKPFKKQYLENPFAHNWIQSLIYYESVKNLQKSGLVVDTFIDWNENQTIDFAFNLALHHFYPRTKVFCYQSYFIDQKIIFHIVPNENELKRNLCSMNFLAISPYLLNENSQKAPFLNIQLAPALRFLNSFSSTKIPKENFITVALPFSLEISNQIISFVQQAAKKLSGISFLIKPHPSIPVGLLRSVDEKNISITNQQTSELLQKSKICVSSVSSVCTEALVYNNCLFIIQCFSELQQIPLPRSLFESSETIVSSYEVEDLVIFIQKIFRENLIQNSTQEIISANVINF